MTAYADFITDVVYRRNHRVNHDEYGFGTVLSARDRMDGLQEVRVAFDRDVPGQTRSFVARYAPMQRVATANGGTPVTSGFADKVLSRADLRDLPKPEPLIDGVLDRRTMALLVGQWGSGKSFLALDWACCVATGKPWQGRGIEYTGPVLYVAAEGAYGLNARVQAWEYAWHKGAEVEGLEVYPDPINLLEREPVQQLVNHVAGRRHALVVLDTVARCMVGGDENSAKDMGLVVTGLDSIKRATDGGAALAVHHLGKDKTAGARGSSALESGMDTVYVADKLAEGVMHLHRTKRKDGPTQDIHDLQLRPVNESCVMEISAAGGGMFSPNETVVTAALRDDFSEVGASAATLMDHTKLGRSSVYAVVNRLVRDGHVIKEGPRYRWSGSGLLSDSVSR